MTRAPPFECELGIDFRLHGWAFTGFYKKNERDYLLGAVSRDTVSLAELFDSLEVPELPLLGGADATLNQLDFLMRGGQITLEGKVSIDWHLPFEKNLRLQVETLEVGVALTNPELGVSSCTVNALGRITRDGAALVDTFCFAFEYDKGKWDVRGQADVRFLDKPFRLSASFTHDYGDVLSFKLAAQQDQRLLDLDALGSLSLTGLGIRIRRGGTAATANRNKWRGEVSVEGSLSITDLLELKGSLYLSDSGLRLVPAKPVTFDLSIVKRANLDVSVSTALKALEICWSGDTKGLREEVSVTPRTKGLPRFVRDAIPDKIRATFFVGTRSGDPAVELTLENASTQLQNASIAIGAGDEKTKIDLRVLNGAQFGLKRIGLRGGRELRVFVGFAVGLPPRINDIFGTTGGQPNLTLFRTGPDDLIDLEFSLGTSPFSANLAFLTPPLVDDWVRADAATRTWEITLGERGQYGQVSIGAPDLNLSGKGFGSHGEVTVLKPLKIPLAPLRQFVGHLVGHAEAQKIIPQAVPIVVPSLLDRDGKLEIGNVLDWIEKTFEPSASEGLKNALKKVRQVVDAAQIGVDRMPGHLKPYLEPQFEHGFEGAHITWDITVGEDASVTLDLKSEQPIRFLMPMGPNLVGFELSRLAFGALLGGSLFKLKLSCDFDQFDLASIIADLVVPVDSPLPITRDFHSRVVIRDLLAIIVYETVVPIPIPIYFQKLELDVAQLLGLSVQAHAELSSNVSLAGVLNLLQEGYQFLKCPNKSLELSAPTLNLFPTLTLRDWYIQLPSWLADDAYLGKKGPIFKLQSAQIIEDVLNTIKFFSFAQVISRVPLEDRSGAVKWDPGTFLGLKLDASAAWLILTGTEFESLRQSSSGDYRGVAGDDEQARALVEVFSRNIALNDRSAICLVKSNVDSGLLDVELMALDVCFGFISMQGSASRASAWETAFAVGGRLGPYTLEADGLVVMDHEPSRFVAHTDCVLRFFDWELFSAHQELEVTTSGFELDGDARVLPLAEATWEAHCSIESGVGARVTASGDASFLGLALANAQFVAKNVRRNGQLDSEIMLSGMFLGANLTLTAERDEHSLLYIGSSKNVFGTNTFLISYKENKAFSTSFTATALGGALGYRVSFTGRDPRVLAPGPLVGSFELTMLKASVFSGQASVEPKTNAYTVNGSIKLIPPNPLGIQIEVRSRGALSADGLVLTGKVNQSLAKLLTLAGTVTLTATKGTQGVSGSGSVTVGPKSFAAKYGLVAMGGEVCFCLSWDGWWKWYVMISGEGLYGPSTKPPPRWLSVLKGQAASRASAPVAVPAGALLLAFLKRIYKNGQMPFLAENDYQKFGALIQAYEIETWFVRAADQQTDGPFRAKIIVRRPRHTEHGIFAELLQVVRIRARGNKDAHLGRARALDTLELEGVMGEGSTRAVWLASETKRRYETVLRDFGRAALNDIAEEIISAG